MAELPNRIREWRKSKGWTQGYVARKLVCSIPQVSDLELGNVPLTYEWMVRLSRVLSVSPADLMLPEHSGKGLGPDECALLERFRAANDDQRRQLVRIAEVLIPFAGEPLEPA